MTGSSPRVRGTLRREIGEVVDHRFIPACAGNTSPPQTSDRGSPVHPRVCGEHNASGQPKRHYTGSSPRVRGTPVRRASHATRRRFIPACAGNTIRLTGGRRAIPVHPRVCGEHSSCICCGAFSGGSSPRVRGTLQDAPVAPAIGRFIPACAGNTQTRKTLPCMGPVHPRVCGEHSRSISILHPSSGSSPRVRGTHAFRPLWHFLHRFIPACAGNTRSPLQVCATEPVHPRVCGEHMSYVNFGFLPAGSSPRVRGTRFDGFCCGSNFRFIPACAGNTFRPTLGIRTSTVHPRVCGEHTSSSIGSTSDRGSSPRVRGTRDEPDPKRLHHRFIPACAGNTRGESQQQCGSAVHPRVCGEHVVDVVEHHSPGGSSPRVRGTQLVNGAIRGRQRFIPACAGNTNSDGFEKRISAVHPRVCGEHSGSTACT